MRKISYLICFTLVATPNLFSIIFMPLSFFGISAPSGRYITYVYTLFFSFGSITPQMVVPLLPTPVLWALGLPMIFLVFRRLWLFFAKKEGIPLSYTGFQKVLGISGAVIYLLAIFVLILSIALNAGSGVPAGMLLIPPMFLIPWSIFITEISSFRNKYKNVALTHPSSGTR